MKDKAYDKLQVYLTVMHKILILSFCFESDQNLYVIAI